MILSIIIIILLCYVIFVSYNNVNISVYIYLEIWFLINFASSDVNVFDPIDQVEWIDQFI